ncbi:MAG: response regulator [Desulfonatronovibrio sp.]
MRILVIDDESVFLNTLITRLELRGQEAKGCSDARTGLDLLNSEKFDVVLIDIKMPGIDGIEALQMVKAQQPDLPVILLTGHACAETAGKGKQKGAYDYLLKPFPMDDLVDKIEEAIKQKP